MKHVVRRGLAMALLMMCCALAALAQSQTVRGKLVDENGAGVAFANVVVNDADGAMVQGTTTDEAGVFAIDCPDGRLTLVATAIGYRTLTVTCSSGDLGTLTMPQDATMLDAVTVEANRTVVHGSQYLVIPDAKDREISAKGIDLLAMQQLPGLRIDRALQSITVDGGTPVLQINGHEVPAHRIANLDPKKVKRIEYANTPGMRYIDRGATGVINIVLKEADDGGSVFLNAESDVQTMMSDAYASTSYHKGRSELALQYNFSRRAYHHGPSEDHDQYIDPLRTVVRDNEMEIPVHYTFHYLNGDYTFQPDDSTMLIASLRGLIMNADNHGGGIMTTLDGDLQEQREMTSSYQHEQFQPTLDVFFTHSMPKGQKIELNVVGETSTGGDTRTICYTTDGIISTYPTKVQNHGWALSGEGVYSRQLGKVGTRWGVQYQHNMAVNDYVVSNVLSTMTKDNTYLFGQAEGPLGIHMNWSLGTGAKVLDVRDDIRHKTYLRNLSTAQLNIRPDDHWTVTYEMRYSPNLPTLGQLSPVLQREDDVAGSLGTPDLRPSQRLDNRLKVNHTAPGGWFIFMQGGYIHEAGAIISTHHYDSTHDLFISTPQNSDYYSNLYLAGETGVKGLWDHLNLSIDGKVMREQTRGEGFEHINDNFSLNARAQLVWGGFSLGANFNIRPEWWLSGELLNKNEPVQNIYAQYQWKNLNAHLMWHCPFNPNGYEYETINLSTIHPSHHINHTSDNGNMVVLGLTWTLDYGSAFHKADKTLSNGGYDSGIVQ